MRERLGGGKLDIKRWRNFLLCGNAPAASVAAIVRFKSSFSSRRISTGVGALPFLPTAFAFKPASVCLIKREGQDPFREGCAPHNQANTLHITICLPLKGLHTPGARKFPLKRMFCSKLDCCIVWHLVTRGEC